MDFAPYQSSPPEHERTFSPPNGNNTSSPRASLERQRLSPRQNLQHPQPHQATNTTSPPPLQHPQPQRQWSGNIPSPDAFPSYQQGGSGDLEDGHFESNRDDIEAFDTSLGMRLDQEAALPYIALPPLGSILLLIAERKSDYVRFHAWQASLVFTAVFIVHLLFSWSSFFSWLIFLGDLVLMAWLAFNAYREADFLERYEVPFFGRIASKIVDDE